MAESGRHEVAGRVEGLSLSQFSSLPAVTGIRSVAPSAAGIPPVPSLTAVADPAVVGAAPLQLHRVPDSPAALRVKRSFDLIGAAFGLVVLVPLLVFVAVLVLVVDGRPVFFVQERVGLAGARFRLVKFRTMVRDAEERFEALAPFSDTLGATFKMWNDPRVTRLGHWLRRSSLDELPQLWNVLRGEMSFVGPRPAPPREVERYDEWHRLRLSMKPGLTGLWQVASRFDRHFDERVGLDLEYIEGWSLWLDVVILLRTIPAVLAMTGR